MTQIKEFNDFPIENTEEQAIIHNDLVNGLKESLTIGQSAFLKSGAYLKEIKENKTYEYEDSTKKTTFNEFLARPDIPIPGATIQSRKRIAYTLIKVYEQLVDKYGISKDRLSPIGWTKLGVVASVLEKDSTKDAEEWLSKAETLTMKDLEDEARHGGTLEEELKCTHEDTEEITIFKCNDCPCRFKEDPNEKTKS